LLDEEALLDVRRAQRSAFLFARRRIHSGASRSKDAPAQSEARRSPE